LHRRNAIVNVERLETEQKTLRVVFHGDTADIVYRFCFFSYYRIHRMRYGGYWG